MEDCENVLAVTGCYDWPKDWFRLKQDFQRVFHFSFVDLYDPWMSFYTQSFMIDILQLDVKLHSLYGDYEENQLSMEDIVRQHYGSDGLELLNSLI